MFYFSKFRIYFLIILVRDYQYFSMKYIFFFPLILLYGLCEEPYVKIVHHTDPDARCLDGTPPALYVHQGN